MLDTYYKTLTCTASQKTSQCVGKICDIDPVHSAFQQLSMLTSETLQIYLTNDTATVCPFTKLLNM